MAQTVAAETRHTFIWQRFGLMPTLALAAAICALAGIAGSAALANAMALRAPAAAITVWPVNGFASANAASELIERANPGRASTTGLVVPAAVRGLAERAIVAEPTAVQGVRNLALFHAANGNAERATRLMRLAARLSARDTPANMYLVESYLRSGDLARATALIDATLRTDTSAGAVLLPGLANILDLPGAEPVMLDMLAGDPPWGHDFWTAVLQSGAELDGATSLRIALHRRGMAFAPGHDAQLIEQLVEARAFDQAFALYAEAGRSAQFPPIDWRLAGGSGLAVSRGAGGKLAVSALGGSAGVVAQRLVALPQGRYTLHIASDAARGQLSARITCAHLHGEGTLAVVLAGSGSFSQPSACRFAWLTLLLQPGSDDRSLAIEAASISRIGGGA